MGQEQELGDLLFRKRRIMEDKQWLILNHSEEQEATLNGLQKVAEIVQQFTSFNWDYLNLPRDKSEKQLKESILTLYWKILRTDEKNLEVIQWVSYKPYISQHYTARRSLSQYPHAGEWIIDKYTKWLHQNVAPAFWLRGTVGTGKTSIMSTIIESFYSDVARQDDHRMIYFYCISPTTSDDVIRSLVSQLAWTSDGNAIEASIVAIFDNAKPPNPTIPITALLKLCQRVSKVIIVIDALDECVDFSKLLATLKNLQVKQPDGIKFVFSSRLNVDVDKVFTALEGVILTTEDTLKDMSEYIENEVRFKEEDIDSNDEETKRQLMDQIVRVLSNFAGGMNIEIQLLNIENRNTSLEQSLNSAYEMVYSINTKPGAYNTSVFKSVFIELSLDHDPKLQRITRSSLSTKVALHCCSNFVIQSSEGNFRFAHLSVEEYLTNHCAVKVEFQYEECHLFAMKICLAFMAQERINSVAKQGCKQGSEATPRDRIAEIADEVIANLPRSDQPSKGRLMILGAAFDLPEILENGLKNHKEEVDARLRDDLTPLLVAIRNGSPDSVKYLLDLGANPTHKFFTRRRHTIHFIRYDHLSSRRLEVENVLLNHEKSRTHFLNQLETHLSILAHPDPLRALKILYGASNEVSISVKIFEHYIKVRGLHELAQVLELIDEDTFDEEMVAEVVLHDSCETVKNVFEFKEVSLITEQVVRNALNKLDSKTLTYLMKQFGHDILTREIVIYARPQSHEVWKVIIDVKGIQFVNQEVLDSLFVGWLDLDAVTLVLDSCGTEMIRSSHVDILVDYRWGYLCDLDPIFHAPALAIKKTLEKDSVTMLLNELVCELGTLIDAALDAVVGHNKIPASNDRPACRTSLLLSKR
ncbi:hypothetical protein BTUL_0004g01140 [Botrytis tulipae]|uniref:Nephrocystin 3-like N-terminal domain-containing protein n=1 Tax=Botrytis tulipae TaxID=87230 RepID=A0A4Z1F4U7_9HELO|nr:hypothetical protein BTUL_0004g01140 [Botrytis tulipae]